MFIRQLATVQLLDVQSQIYIDQPMAPSRRDTRTQTDKDTHVKAKNEHDQEIPQSHTGNQPMAPLGRATVLTFIVAIHL